MKHIAKLAKANATTKNNNWHVLYTMRKKYQKEESHFAAGN